MDIYDNTTGCSYCDPGSFEEHTLSHAKWVRLTLFNNGGDLFITAHGDNDCSYEPKFCPECGRRIVRVYDLIGCEED